MGRIREELNIGQLCLERFGNSAALIGLGTHIGTVAAATDWDGDMQIKQVRASRRDSYVRICHDSGDETSAVTPLGPDLPRRIGVPETYPFAL